MELLLDSADPREIEEVRSWGMISGVTTNPTLWSKTGGDISVRLREIVAASPGCVFVQAIGWADPEVLIRQARWLARQSEKIVVKIPIGIAGIQAVLRLKKEVPTMRIAVTAVASVAQALLCGKAGADVVALFNGPLDEASDAVIDMVSPVKQIYTRWGFATKVLSCCRFPRGVGQFAAAGSDYCTMKKEFHQLLYEHPFTDKRMTGFLGDWRKTFGDRTWPGE